MSSPRQYLSSQDLSEQLYGSSPSCPPTTESKNSMDNRTIRASKFVWLDAYEGEGEWYGTDYEPELRHMTTYGYPIAITDTYIAIASTYDPEMEQYACVICIPIGMLVTVTPVSDRNEEETTWQASADTETQRQCTLRPSQLQD